MVSFCSYRTRLLCQAKANAFAAALRNNSRFAMVTVEKSTRAKSDKAYLVRFEPSNAARKAALVDAAQDARTERAINQEFTFAQDPDHDFCHCHSHSSGEVYSVTLETCDCPDSEYRCSKVGLACKHRIALALAIRAGLVEEFRPIPKPVIDRDMRWVRDQEAFAQVFG